MSLYNSKLINGGIRLTQNRNRKSSDGWGKDEGVYTEEWIPATETNNQSAWTYRSIPVIKYFDICTYKTNALKSSTINKLYEKYRFY